MMRQIRVRLGRSGQDRLWMCGDPANVVGKLGLCIEPEAGDAGFSELRMALRP